MRYLLTTCSLLLFCPCSLLLAPCPCVPLPSIAKAAERWTAPSPTTEFEYMSYFPLYPTFSWQPLARSQYYELKVIRQEGRNETVYRVLKNTEALDRLTDYVPFNETGNYYWQVHVTDRSGNPLSDWSAKKYFKVTAPVTFAALGDSITHGGAAFIPAGQLSCQWETFCEVPIKNLGRSGDTTAMMLERFDNDVLPFRPKVLLILGGVNDIREGAKAEEVIENLTTIREKCLANDIKPVFVAITSMNPKIIRATLTDGDWQSERDKLNKWINGNEYSLDFNVKLNDEQGYLKVEYTPDGLHPNLRGKQIMGEAINEYLQEAFKGLMTN